MKKMAAAFCLVITSLTAHAGVISGESQVLTGKVSLKNQNGELIEILNGSAQFQIEKPGILTGFSRWYKGENKLRIQIGSNSFLLHVPEKQMKSETEFSVHQHVTQQGVHLVSNIVKSASVIRTLSTQLSCTALLIVPVPNDVMDSNGAVTTTVENKPVVYPGKQHALIQEESWTEFQKLQIYNAEGSLEIRSLPQVKTKQTILEKKEDCKI